MRRWRRYMVVKQCVESGFIEILQFLLTELQKSDLNFKNTDSRGKLLNEWKNWNKSSYGCIGDIYSENDMIKENAFIPDIYYYEWTAIEA